MTEPSNAPVFREFMAASALSPANIVSFGEGVRAFEPLDPPPEPYVQASPEQELPLARDGLQSLLRTRRSKREFGPRQLSVKNLGNVFSSFAQIDERRTYPSAGGLYPLHVFGLLLKAEEPWQMTAVRYEPRTHGLAVMQKLGSLQQVRDACSLEEGVEPQGVVVFVVDPEEAERKYGERAGRFAMIEIGHAAQNLALRLARGNLSGYELGGIQDASIKALLGLSGTNALVAHAYAIGRGPRRFWWQKR